MNTGDRFCSTRKTKSPNIIFTKNWPAESNRQGTDELRHYRIWQSYTEEEVAPKRGIIQLFYWISRLFGLTFGVKLMERGEGDAQDNYSGLNKIIPEADAIIREENEHESALLQPLSRKRCSSGI